MFLAWLPWQAFFCRFTNQEHPMQVHADILSARLEAASRRQEAAPAPTAAADFAAALESRVAPKASGGHSAAWEEFFSRRQIGTSEDGLPIMAETEAEKTASLRNYARFAASQGLNPTPTTTAIARMPVSDGMMGPTLGYKECTLYLLPTQGLLKTDPLAASQQGA
jgi:hypothetical protein